MSRGHGNGQAPKGTVRVFSLGRDPHGETVIVWGAVPVFAKDASDLSEEVAVAERRLASLGYLVFGSFLETDAAAAIVDLAKSKQVF